jgi:hypothetical protein
MKVSGAGSTTALGSARSANRSVATGFDPAVEETAAPAAAARASAVGAVNSLDALLALQETLSPMERRKRAVRLEAVAARWRSDGHRSAIAAGGRKGISRRHRRTRTR